MLGPFESEKWANFGAKMAHFFITKAKDGFPWCDPGLLRMVKKAHLVHFGPVLTKVMAIMCMNHNDSRIPTIATHTCLV